ncbi:MAG: hypothetical protein V3R54_06450 [Thermodesulfovibrionia bacterium]
MPSRRRKKTKYKKHYHILFILFLIVAVTFFLYEESGKEDLQGKKTALKVLDIKTPLTFSELISSD